MSRKFVFAAALIAAFVISGPAQQADAQTTTETKAEAKKAAKAERKSNRTAAQARQKQCGTEWKEARKAGKVEKNMTWPKYYSECNKRLKGKAA
jgi:uncharacterized protein with WD repeat